MRIDKTIEALHSINNHGSQNACHLLTVAATIVALGWRKQDVRAFLYERVRQPVHLLQVGGMYDTETHRNLWPRRIDRDPVALARAYELSEARAVAVQHPLAALAPKVVMQRATAVVERIIEQLMTTH